MFQVKNMTITHKKDLTTLVEGLSFTLSPGDRAALIGEEGEVESIQFAARVSGGRLEVTLTAQCLEEIGQERPGEENLQESP